MIRNGFPGVGRAWAVGSGARGATRVSVRWAARGHEAGPGGGARVEGLGREVAEGLPQEE